MRTLPLLVLMVGAAAAAPAQMRPVIVSDAIQHFDAATPPLLRSPAQAAQVDPLGGTRAVLDDMTARLPRHVSIDAIDIVADPLDGAAFCVLFSTGEECRLPLLDTGSPFPVLPGDIIAYRPSTGQFNLSFRSLNHGLPLGANLDAFAVAAVTENLTSTDLHVSYDVTVKLRVCDTTTGSCDDAAIIHPAGAVRFESFQFTERTLDFTSVPGFHPGWNLASLERSTPNPGVWLAAFDTTTAMQARRPDDQLALSTFRQGSVLSLSPGNEPLSTPFLDDGNLPLRDGVGIAALAVWPAWLGEALAAHSDGWGVY